jgi:O-antigen/teichoic acid export membrane protein
MTTAASGDNLARGETTLRELFLTGLGWTAASFGGVRLVSLGQTIILARLLAPSDFGGFAMAALAISITEVFSSIGILQAIVQSRLDDRATLDTAFCINLCRGVLLYAALFWAAPLVESFYETPGVAVWIRVLALTTLLDSAGNVGMMLYLKELDYRRAAVYGQLPSLVYALSAVMFAIWIRSAWALVLAQVTASLVQLPFSYWAHPYRPRLRIERAALRHLIEYGRFVLGSAPFFYLSAHIDEIAIGRRFGSHSMGAYQLSYNTAALPATYLGELVSGVLFPVFARLQSTPASLRDAYLKTVRHLANICLPVSAALLLFAPEFVRLVYGSRWEEAIPILRAFCVYGAIRPIGSVTIQVFRAIGETQQVFRLAVVNLVVIFWAILVGISHGTIWVAVLISVMSVPVVLYAFELLARVLALRTAVIVRACAPAAAAGTIAIAVTVLARPVMDAVGFLPLRLALGLVMLGGIYLPTLLLVDRHSLGEIRELLQAKWPRLAGNS